MLEMFENTAQRNTCVSVGTSAGGMICAMWAMCAHQHWGDVGDVCDVGDVGDVGEVGDVGDVGSPAFG